MLFNAINEKERGFLYTAELRSKSFIYLKQFTGRHAHTCCEERYR